MINPITIGLFDAILQASVAPEMQGRVFTVIAGLDLNRAGIDLCLGVVIGAIYEGNVRKEWALHEPAHEKGSRALMGGNSGRDLGAEIGKPGRRAGEHSWLAGPAIVALATVAALACFAFLALYQLVPPAPLPAGAPLSEFSAGRAWAHLEVIARQPHPAGSPAQSTVRGYLVRELTGLGLDPRLQPVAATRGGEDLPLYNVLARLRGSGGGDAVLLVAHYDSVPEGPGAGDDGLSVAALLEVLRALQSAGPLRNDVIALFTDGEELGLLGGCAFAAEHPWRRDVRVVLNLEACDRGAPVVVQTGPQNALLVAELARAHPHPLAASAAPEVFARLGFQTDLTPFTKAGLAGLGVDVVGDTTDYHTARDSLANVDRGSLQAHGAAALAVARRLGQADLERPAAGDAVYFGVLGQAFVYYPAAWAAPLAVLLLLLTLTSLAWGLRRGRLTLAGLGWGALAFLGVLLVAPAAVTAAWEGIRALHGEYRALSPLGHTANSRLYLAAFAALTLAIFSLAYGWLRRRLSPADLAAAALLLWAALGVAASFLLPGASYLLAWPLLAGLAALALAGPATWPRWLGLTLAAFPGIVLFVPALYLAFIATGVSAFAPLMAGVVLLLSSLVPQLELIAAWRRWALPTVAALASLALLAAGSLTAGWP